MKNNCNYHVKRFGWLEVILFTSKCSDGTIKTYRLCKAYKTGYAGIEDIYKGSDVKVVRELWHKYIDDGYEVIEKIDFLLDN
jgi:hypothetical protein